MHIKSEKGMTGIDLAISVIVITIFMSIIANVIVNINLNSKNIERQNIATSYAMQEIEKAKGRGITEYNNRGIDSPYVIEEDIYKIEGEGENETSTFTGFHKKITVEDYVLLKQDNTLTENIVKKVTKIKNLYIG